MKRSIFALATLMATSLMAHDPTPSCLANPLTGLAGNYTFQIEGIYPHAYGITGTFNASIGTNRAGASVGVLRVTATSFFTATFAGAASVTRLETDIGSFQVNPSCTGGTLTFNLSSHPMQFDFYFSDAGRQISIISTINGLEATGVAIAGPTGCPAGLPGALQLLPTRWAFTARGVGVFAQTSSARQPAGVRQVQVVPSPNNPFGIAGFWDASVGADRAGNPLGILAITATSNLGYLGQSVTRLEADAGRYQANADCSGGTLTHNMSSRPMQYDFWYVSGFQKMFFIATNGVPALGEASR
jgi:hypothetical protein